jgi:hypothetical protein
MGPTPPPPGKPQARAVAILSMALAALLLLWAIGSYVLIAHTPDFGEPPSITPSPSVTS